MQEKITCSSKNQIVDCELLSLLFWLQAAAIPAMAGPEKGLIAERHERTNQFGD
ncbi:hypothetical protein GTP44_11060 [Duganella sp. FT50W]|uniref:Uncharacterized protein n=1 Tax=Duganella lactea TaxID=2692173 RepID=A0A6L8MJU4_9BURK|nr:hypothetical protein [Duganella lactea]MYM82491.1 hypothetical protein [Duganella lactea]